MLSEILQSKKQSYAIKIHMLVMGAVSIAYLINSALIKPITNENENFLCFFVHNYFNDVGAGLMIASLANILLLRGNKRYAKSIFFYILLAFFECIIWELVRPYILLVFNPFGKTPKFLWGDMIAYSVGTFSILFINKVIDSKT